METLKTIEQRRSIRKFTNEKISKSIIEDIINCGRLSPSAKNRQPWYFVIVDGITKEKIANMMIDYTLNNDETVERKNMGCPSSVNPTANVIKESPVLILIFREKNDDWIVGDNFVNWCLCRKYVLKSNRFRYRFFMDKRYSICS